MPERRSRPLGADDTLEGLLGRALRALRHTWAGGLDDLGLAPHQGRALRITAESGPLRMSELAERLRIAPRSVTEVADVLELRGLLTRSPDPTDRRATLVAVTSAGSEAAEEFARLRRAHAEEFFRRLDQSDRDELARILRHLLDESA